MRISGWSSDVCSSDLNERLPAAYLTGEAWLQGYRFTVDPRVIVPRSPISECLVQGLAPWISDPEDVDFVLDLCTGSGCLAVLAALALDRKSTRLNSSH